MTNAINNTERGKTWDIYPPGSSDPTTTPTPSRALGGGDEEAGGGGGLWTASSSMNAISFGFVATAILISMFLVMAIFEHLFRPNDVVDESFSSSANSLRHDPTQTRTINTSSSSTVHKLGTPHTMAAAHAPDYPVLMPGQQHPSFIAQPAPLPREGVVICYHNHMHACSVMQVP